MMGDSDDFGAPSIELEVISPSTYTGEDNEDEQLEALGLGRKFSFFFFF